MFSFKELFEAKDAGGHGSEKHHVTAFTRMNPPTTGHMQVISKLHAVAKEHGAEHSLVVSHSNDAKKNPLTPEQKIKHLGRYSPETKVSSSSKESPTILHHAAALHKSGVQHLHVVAGSDRHEQMHKLLHQYNGKDAGHGHYNFKSITMHSSGDRDPDSEGTEGMSGTKMRQHAHDNNFKEFRKGVPSHVSDKHAHELMSDVRKGSGIKEEAISYETFMEARMSAAVKLQRAFEREQQKSAASRERAKELLAPKKPEPVKEETIDETIVKVDSGYEVQSHTGKNLGKSPTLAGAKKRLKQVEYFKHMKEEEMVFEDFDDKNLAKQDLANKKNKGGIRGNVIAALKRKAGLTESVHDNRTGFTKRKREDDEYHNGGDLDRHTYKYTVSKPGVNDGKKHERHVTTPLTSRKKHEIEHLARAHLTKQGYEIHEEAMQEEQKRGPYKQKSAVVIAPKEKKAKTYGDIVSKLRPVSEESEVYAKAEENKRSADAAKKQGNMFDHHMHMADHHDNLAQWHSEKGRHSVADTHASKAEEHHEKAMSLKENTLDESMTDSWKSVQSMDKGSVTGGKHEVKKRLAYLTAVHAHHKKFGNDTHKVKKEIESINRSRISEEAEEIEEATPYYNKPSFLKNMGRIAKQERLAREKKEAEAKQKPVKEEAESVEEGATGYKPGWMLRQDPVLAKKVKDSKRGHEALKKWAGKPINKNVKEETQETEMGLKSFSTLVKEGTLQSSGDDSIPTLTKAPVAPTLDRKYIKGTPENKALKASRKPINGHPTNEEYVEEGVLDTVKKVAKKAAEVLGGPDDEGHKKDLQRKMGVPQTGKPAMAKQNEEVEQIEERNKENATKRKMMDASRGARFKLNNPVPDAGPEHKTGQAHNKAIGRALRSEESELEEAKHVAPTNKKPAVDVDKVNAAGQEPHHETFEDHKKVKKESFSVAELFQALKEGMWPGTPEYKAKYDGAKQGGGSGIKKGTRYGGSLQKDEPEHDDDAPKAGRPTGAKSGARKNLGNSKLHK
jgi:hypothetical protein